MCRAESPLRRASPILSRLLFEEFCELIATRPPRRRPLSKVILHLVPWENSINRHSVEFDYGEFTMNEYEAGSR